MSNGTGTNIAEAQSERKSSQTGLAAVALELEIVEGPPTRDFLAIALDCAERGWHVFPCHPKSKRPVGAFAPNGFLNATTDENTVRSWWAMVPEANVAIATGASGLCVLDCDHGFEDHTGFLAWHIRKNLPMSYAVRTGRRDFYGVQLYFTGTDIKSIAWEEGGVGGDIRCSSGYVMAAGSIHPDSGETYEELWPGLAPVPVPSYVARLRPAPRTGTLGNQNAPVTDDGGPISAHRNVHMISLLGKKRSEGGDDDALREYALEVNEARMSPPLDEEELERLITNACKFAIPEPEPIPVLAGKVGGPSATPEPMDAWSRFHSFNEMDKTPPLTWLIDGFLPFESITGLAAAVAQRKSIIALNIAHALVTGEPLFGHFKVHQMPDRVLYLCPEMGIRSFTRRLREIGLVEHVGKRLFCQTMSSDYLFTMDSLPPEVLRGSFVILDTAIRYIEGDESNSEHMRKFGAKVMRLKADGAVGSLILYHSSKGAKETLELTLENSLRGSSELGAFITNCWATRLQDPSDQFATNSYMNNVKPRDYEDKPPAFELAPVKGSYRMTYVEGSEGAQLACATLFKKDADGKADGAIAVIKAHPEASLSELEKLTEEAGCPRKKSWISRERAALRGSGNTLTPAPQPSSVP